MQRILELAAGRGAVLTAEGAERLAAYVTALVDAGACLNLSAAKTEAEALAVLVGPSLALARAWTRPDPPRRVVDIGSGNGFPGVVAAVIWSDADVVLVERRGRKARAIATCLDAAGLRAQVLAIDAREIRREAPRLLGATDLVAARGVGALDVVNRMAAPLLAPGGVVVHWKAFNMEQAERSVADQGSAALGLVPAPDVAFEPGPPGPGRLVRYTREGGAR